MIELQVLGRIEHRLVPLLYGESHATVIPGERGSAGVHGVNAHTAELARVNNALEIHPLHRVPCSLQVIDYHTPGRGIPVAAAAEHVPGQGHIHYFGP